MFENPKEKCQIDLLNEERIKHWYLGRFVLAHTTHIKEIPL